ncbi:hypothetical protein NEMIN01_1265 [Nematocida minor]|uniref:uncharacterized protein n=1 Tax=Nematocida minor TaxID=1912983 RepID=UPI00221E7EF7|nr:uncharacterized protein NEMIN01_1265 [Nematocida minor]KAI5190863.1 hypothetical protein NEMIN01_1265 [Nematocida minor]
MEEKQECAEASEDFQIIPGMNKLHKNIVLISSTRESAVVPYYILSESSILKKIIDTQIFKESKEDAIVLPISYPCLKRIVEYLWYKHKYHTSKGAVEDFKIEDSETLDLLEVSSFLRL